MKQLKFMLAAATAFGLASAQAATDDKKLVNENFNSYPADQVVTEITGFSFEGAEGDNESAIIKQAEGDMALKVNTGTDPLLRALDYNNNTGAQDLDLADPESAINYLNIDTTVQFTVTPEGDTVLPGLIDSEAKDEEGNVLLKDNIKEDKLLIYLQEKTVGETKSNVLTVWASSVTAGSDDDFGTGTDEFMPTKVEIPGVEVVPNQDYRLQVKSYIENGIVLFSIKLGDTELASAEALYASATQGTKAFPSLLGKASTLTYVGFAGEGTVDDLVVTKNYNVPDVLDFTFAIDIDEGVSSVVYTIGEGESAADATVEADVAAITVASGTKVTLKEINLKPLYVLASDSAKENESKTISANGESFVVKTTALTGEGENVVPDGTTAAQIGITNTEFEKADNTQLNSLVKWATSTGKGSLELVNSMTFDTNGNPAGEGKTAAEAYLLDCATTEVETKKDDFKLTISFDENGLPVVTGPDGAATYKNGKIVLKGREKLSEGDWADKAEGHKFFKAFLTK